MVRITERQVALSITQVVQVVILELQQEMRRLVKAVVVAEPPLFAWAARQEQTS